MILPNNPLKTLAKKNHSKCLTILQTDRREWFEKHVKTALLPKISDSQERDSGSTLHHIANLTVNICK